MPRCRPPPPKTATATKACCRHHFLRRRRHRREASSARPRRPITRRRRCGTRSQTPAPSRLASRRARQACRSRIRRRGGPSLCWRQGLCVPRTGMRGPFVLRCTSLRAAQGFARLEGGHFLGRAYWARCLDPAKFTLDRVRPRVPVGGTPVEAAKPWPGALQAQKTHMAPLRRSSKSLASSSRRSACFFPKTPLSWQARLDHSHNNSAGGSRSKCLAGSYTDWRRICCEEHPDWPGVFFVGEADKAARCWLALGLRAGSGAWPRGRLRPQPGRAGRRTSDGSACVGLTPPVSSLGPRSLIGTIPPRRCRLRKSCGGHQHYRCL